MKKAERTKLKREVRYCDVFGHSVSMGQCCVCKLPLSKLILEINKANR